VAPCSEVVMQVAAFEAQVAAKRGPEPASCSKTEWPSMLLPAADFPPLSVEVSLGGQREREQGPSGEQWLNLGRPEAVLQWVDA